MVLTPWVCYLSQWYHDQIKNESEELIEIVSDQVSLYDFSYCYSCIQWAAKKVAIGILRLKHYCTGFNA